MVTKQKNTIYYTCTRSTVQYEATITRAVIAVDSVGTRGVSGTCCSPGGALVNIRVTRGSHPVLVTLAHPCGRITRLGGVGSICSITVASSDTCLSELVTWACCKTK